MRKVVILILLTAWFGFGCAQSIEQQYQSDADKFRAAHLLDWAKIIEEYYQKTGHYPLQNRAKERQIMLVVIASREQQAYLDPKNPNYQPAIDFANANFTKVPLKDMVVEIEHVLGREIEERYDPQRVPTGVPNYFSYFADSNGYLIWSVCRTCPPQSNSFSTLLDDGVPSINIGSRWFIEHVPKTQSIATLTANKEFIAFVGNGAVRAGAFKLLEQAQIHDSKK